MIKLWNWIVRFFHRKRIAEIDRIEQMYGSEDGLEKRLEELYDRYNHLNSDMPGEAHYRPGDPKPSALETTNVIDGDIFKSTAIGSLLIFDDKSALPIARESTPVQKRVVELLKEKPVPPPKRHDEI